MSETVSVRATIGVQLYETSLQTTRHTWQADEPQALGGSDTAPTPSELVASGLASCTAITLRMYANRKGWDIPQISVTVGVSSTTLDGQLQTIFSRSIQLPESLSDEQRNRLLAIANACPTHKMLSNPIEVVSTLV